MEQSLQVLDFPNQWPRLEPERTQRMLVNPIRITPTVRIKVRLKIYLQVTPPWVAFNRVQTISKLRMHLDQHSKQSRYGSH